MNQWIVLFCLIYNKAKSGHILSLLREEYFYENLPRQVFIYIIELTEKGITPDLSLIQSRFAINPSEINLDLQVDIEHYEEYIENLRKVFVSLEIKKLGKAVSNRDEINENAFVDYVDNLLTNIHTGKKDNLHYAENIAEEFYTEANSETEKINPITYGVESLDKFTNGISSDELILIAGRPSMGKSGWMGHIALTNAMKGEPVIFFSLEMSAKKIINRMFADYCDMDLWKFKKIKNRSTEDQKVFTEAKEKFKKMPLIIDTTSGLDINLLKSILQKVKMKYGKIGLVIIDYLQLMEHTGDTVNNSIANTLKKLKGITTQQQTPVIVGSQLSRLCEQREGNRRPILSDLRDSGSIEQDADVVMMVYRDHYYNYNPENVNICELIIRKNRNGEIGKVIVDYNLKSQHFKSINPNSNLGKIAKRFEYE